METTYGPQRQRLSDQSSQSAEHVVANLRPRSLGTYSEPTITKGAMLPVVLEVQAWHPGNCNLPHSVSGEDQRQNHSQRASGEKNEVKQHGNEDSEKNIEATMRSQSSAHRRAGRERMKRTEKSKANCSRQKSIANSRQSNQRTPLETRRSTRRSTVKYKEKHSTKIGCVSQPVPKQQRTDADVQQEQGEVIMTIQKIDFNQTAQKQQHKCRRSRRIISAKKTAR